jgi:hypothetical protein
MTRTQHSPRQAYSPSKTAVTLIPATSACDRQRAWHATRRQPRAATVHDRVGVAAAAQRRRVIRYSTELTPWQLLAPVLVYAGGAATIAARVD